MVIYLVCLYLIFFLHLVSIRKKKTKLFCTVLAGCLLFLVSALRRGDVGTDTPAYVTLYEQIFDRWNELFSAKHLWSGFELGFVLYVAAIRSIFGPNPQFLIVISSFISVFAICFLFYKNSRSPCLALAIYVLLMCWFEEMNIMRASLAYSIVFLGFEYLKKKEFLVFSVFVLIAFFFHRVALIFLLLIPLTQIKNNPKNLLIFSILGVLSSICARPLFFVVVKFIPAYSKYLDSFSGTNFFGAIFQFAVPLSIIVAFLFVFRKALMAKPSHKICVEPNLSLQFKIVFLYTILCSYIMSATILLRLASPFSYFLPLFLVNFYDFSKLNCKKIYTPLLWISILFLFLYFFIVQIYRPEWATCVPYAFFWMNNKFPSFTFDLKNEPLKMQSSPIGCARMNETTFVEDVL